MKNQNQIDMLDHKLTHQIDLNRRCASCFYFKKGCTYESNESHGKVRRIMPKRDIEVFTACSDFLDEYDATHQVFFGQAWWDPKGDVFSEDSYGISFDSDTAQKLFNVVGPKLNLRIFRKYLAKITLPDTPIQGRYSVKVPEIGRVLLENSYVPFPSSMRLTITVIKERGQEELAMGGLWHATRSRNHQEVLSEILAHRAREFWDDGELEGALFLCEESLRLNLRNDEAIVGKGLALLEKGKREEAWKCFTKALRNNRFSIHAWVGRAKAKETVEEGGGDRYFEEGLRRTPEDAALWFGRACWTKHTERFDAAVAYCDKALSILPDCRKAHLVRRRALRESGIPVNDESRTIETWIRELPPNLLYASQDKAGGVTYNASGDSGTFAFPTVHWDKRTGRVTGIEILPFIRNTRIPRKARTLRITAKPDLDVEIPITKEFWTGPAVFEHPAIAKWLEKNKLVDIPYYSNRKIALRVDKPEHFELVC